MRKIALFLLAGSLAGATLWAQTTVRRSIRAAGEASVTTTPNQARIAVGVITQAATADEASTRNANQVSGVLAQLRALLGAAADIKTISYSLTPNYTSPRDGTPSVISSYTAANTVQITTGDLSAIGRVIDTAIQAGANRVTSLQFGLRDEEPLRAQALRSAAGRAKAHADAIAAGLGVRTGAILSAEEGTAIRTTLDTRVSAAGPTTPVEPGLVSVHATVSIEVEIAP